MGFVNRNNFGGVAKHAAKIALNQGVEYLVKEGQKLSMGQLNSAHQKLAEGINNIKIHNGLHIGSISNGMRPIINNSADNLVYKHSSSSEKTCISEISSVIYKTIFHVGKPSSNSLYEQGRIHLVDTKTLIDTERDYVETIKRKDLTSTFGFNQRSHDFLLEDTHSKVQDFDFLYKNEKKNFQSNLANVSYYGDIFWEHSNIRIKSETDFYSIQIKIHLVKILDVNLSARQAILKTVNSSSNISEQYKIPIGRQLSSPKLFGNFRCQVLTDLKCTLNLSDWFKDNTKIVKTFYRTLAPNDIWNFDFYMHYGPGILLNRIHEEMQNKETNNHPTGYVFLIQAEGDPRASITRTRDGENFNGTSPGRFNYSFKRRLKFVKKKYESTTILTSRMFMTNDEDFEDTLFQEYFTPDRQEKMNVDVTDINVNRVTDNKYNYQVRYGEGRLSVYLSPYLKSIIEGASDGFEGLKSNNTTSTDDENNVMNEDDIVGEEGTEEDLTDPTRGIRGSNEEG